MFGVIFEGSFLCVVGASAVKVGVGEKRLGSVGTDLEERFATAGRVEIAGAVWQDGTSIEETGRIF